MASNEEDTTMISSDVQNKELSIIRLSSTIASFSVPEFPERTSDMSSGMLENPAPASLVADLNHYKELFSKLRFSYIEQVTKEKFLRAIVGDPPQVIEHYENVELEAQLVHAKVGLKAKKLEVDGMVEKLETRGRELSRRYRSINLQNVLLSDLPTKVIHFQGTLSILQAERTSGSSVPSMSLPLPLTLDLLSSRQKGLDDLDQQLKKLQQTFPRILRDREHMENELKPLEAQKVSAVLSAQDARRRKAQGERSFGDDLELKSRWNMGVEISLKELLSV